MTLYSKTSTFQFDADPAFYFGAVPDPAFQFDADSDPQHCDIRVHFHSV
jgi:hypothetical protein